MLKRFAVYAAYSFSETIQATMFMHVRSMFWLQVRIGWNKWRQKSIAFPPR